MVDEALSMVVVPGMLRRRPTRSEGDSEKREKKRVSIKTFSFPNTYNDREHCSIALTTLSANILLL